MRKSFNCLGLFLALFSFVLIFHSLNLVSINDPEIEQPALAKKRGLLVFIDDSEHFGSNLVVTDRVFNALQDKFGPIVVSTVIIKTIFDQDNQNKEYYKKINFNQQEWIIRIINSAFALFIPRSYLERHGIDYYPSETGQSDQ